MTWYNQTQAFLSPHCSSIQLLHLIELYCTENKECTKIQHILTDFMEKYSNTKIRKRMAKDKYLNSYCYRYYHASAVAH